MQIASVAFNVLAVCASVAAAYLWYQASITSLPPSLVAVTGDAFGGPATVVPLERVSDALKASGKQNQRAAAMTAIAALLNGIGVGLSAF